MEKVQLEVASASKYYESNVEKSPEICSMQLSSLQDSVNLILALGRTKRLDRDLKQVLTKAQLMMRKLEDELDRVRDAKFAALSSSPNCPGIQSTVPEPASDQPLAKDHVFHTLTALTTCTVVESPKNGRKTSVRLIITSGNPSYVSEDVVERLGLMSVFEEKIAHLKATKITNSTITMDLLVHVPNRPPVPLTLRIAENVNDEKLVTPTVAEFKKEHPHLADMHFPDTGSGLPIDLLIGGDSELASIGFNRGLNGEECPQVNRSKGWSLVSSMFGWIIVGIDKDERIIFSI